MPAIDPVAPDAVDPRVQAAIEDAASVGALGKDWTTAYMWAHRPELALAQLPLHARYHDSNILDERLLELVRLCIAVINDCTGCLAARKSNTVSEEDIACISSSDPRFSERERAAMRFAELFAADHTAIDQAVIDELKQYFSDQEIVELAMYSGLMLGSGRFAFVLRTYASDVPTAAGAVSAGAD
jgi:alkylhydroperoxidase family enzyme